MVRENECFESVNYGIKTCPCCNLDVRGNCELICRSKINSRSALQLVRAWELRGERKGEWQQLAKIWENYKKLGNSRKIALTNQSDLIRRERCD